jgi:hypothetical protein
MQDNQRGINAPWRLRKVLVRTVLFSVLGAAVATHAQAASFSLGGYWGDPDASNATVQAAFEARLQSFTKALGATPTMINSYLDYTQPMSTWISSASWQAWSNANTPGVVAMTPVIGFPLATVASGSPSADAQFQAFAAGQNDTLIAGVVQAWTAQGYHSLIVRIGWEMNIAGPSYAGSDSKSQSDWKAAFRHVATVLRQKAAANGASMQIVWNPNETNYASVSATKSLYPGDPYVDIVGVDMCAGLYPFTDGNGAFHDWVTGQEDYSLSEFIGRPGNRWHYWNWPAATEWSLDGSGGHSQSMLSLIAFAQAHHKAFALPEIGAGNSDAGNDVADDWTYPKWIGAILSKAMAGGLNVAFVNIWDINDQGNYEFSETADGKPQERAAWGKYVGVLAR